MVHFDVFQCLCVVGVAETASYLFVRLRDQHGHLHVIRYHFADRLERIRHRHVLTSWQDALTPLTYIRHSGEGVLVDDEAAFWQAFA